MSSTTQGWLAKRALTDNSKAGPALLTQMGEKLLKENMAAEAVMFFKAANNEDALYRAADAAAEEGNFFIYHEVAKILGPEKTGQGRLLKLIQQAEDLGLGLYAQSALKYKTENF